MDQFTHEDEQEAKRYSSGYDHRHDRYEGFLRGIEHERARFLKLVEDLIEQAWEAGYDAASPMRKSPPKDQTIKEILKQTK